MSGIERIAAERQRQIDEEGYTAEHDATHEFGELAMAGALLAAPRPLFMVRQSRESETGHAMMETVDPWPWKTRGDRGGGRDDTQNWNVTLPAFDLRHHPRLRRLEMAGALIAAEIDRLLAIDEKRALRERLVKGREAAPGRLEKILGRVADTLSRRMAPLMGIADDDEDMLESVTVDIFDALGEVGCEASAVVAYLKNHRSWRQIDDKIVSVLAGAEAEIDRLLAAGDEDQLTAAKEV